MNISTTQGWKAADTTKGSIAYSNGVMMSVTAEDGGAMFDVPAPISLEGATATFVINVSNEFKVSGASIQPFAQLQEGDWPGHWDCWLDNSNLTPGVDQTVTCLLDTPTNVLNSTTAGAQIGLKARVSEAKKGAVPTGTVLIKSATITYPAPSTGTDVPVTKDWRAVDAAAISYANGGVLVSPTAKDGGAVFDVAAPIALEGATVTFVVNANSQFKTSGASIQPFAQLKEGTWPGSWSCWLDNGNLTPGVDQTITCLLDTEKDVLNSSISGAQIGLKAVGATVSGTVLIKSVKIAYAKPLVGVNFESDTPNAPVYGVIGYNNTPTATVVTVASVTGLPANGASTKVAKVISAGDYNTIPKFLVTIPAGKTLANYKIKVDAYFPKNTVGFGGGEGNYYKDFLLFAGASITGSAAQTSTYYHSKIGTVYEEVDVWKTFTFSVDAAKAASLTGAVEIGLGINRPLSVGSNDAYYLDNITLVELP